MLKVFQYLLTSLFLISLGACGQGVEPRDPSLDGTWKLREVQGCNTISKPGTQTFEFFAPTFSFENRRMLLQTTVSESCQVTAKVNISFPKPGLVSFDSLDTVEPTTNSKCENQAGIKEMISRASKQFKPASITYEINGNRLSIVGETRCTPKPGAPEEPLTAIYQRT